MDKFLRSIKFVNLLEQNCNCYLTACEDKKTVTLVRKHDWSEFGAVPKGAEWKVKWVKTPNGDFTGKCRLHSIYKKVLLIRREGDGSRLLKVYQDRLPAPDAHNTAIEWSLSVKQLSFEGHEIEAQLVIEYDQVSYFLTGPKSMMSNYERFASPGVEPLKSACRLRVHNWILLKLFNTEQQQQKQKRKEDLKKSNANTPTPPNTIISTDSKEIAVGRTGVGNNRQVSQQFTGWQVGQVVLNYFNPGAGGSFSRYNSGQNINGSGTQTNGDVKVNTQIGNTRDVSVNFISNNS